MDSEASGSASDQAEPVTEWGRWLAAYRRLPGNPISNHLAVAMQRRKIAIPAWKRYILPVLTSVGVLAGCVSFVVRSPAPLRLALLIVLALSGGGLLAYLLTKGRTVTSMFGVHRGVLIGLALLPAAALAVYVEVLARDNLITRYSIADALQYIFYVLCVAFVLFATGRLYAAVHDALHVLAVPRRGSGAVVLDDLVAITVMDARDIVLGVVAVLLPRLWVINLQGAALIGCGALVWCLTMQSAALGGVMIIITMLAIVTGTAITGMMASAIIILWHLCLGRSSTGRFSPVIAGVMVCFGHLMYYLGPLALYGLLFQTYDPFTERLLMSRWMVVADNPHLLGTALLPPALFVLAYFLLLWWFAGRPGRAPAVAFLAPLLLPVSLVFSCFMLPVAGIESRRSMFMLATSQLYAWGGVVVFNPYAESALQLFQFQNSPWTGQLEWLLLGLAVLYAQQAVMIVIGLLMAKCAVQRRRTEFA